MKQKPDAMTIGRLSAQCGCKVQTIRYYEQIGLMPAPERSEGGQRRYNQKQAVRLDFIRHGRELGFALDAIDSLLGLADAQTEFCEAADSIARTHLRDVKNRIQRLQSLQAELENMLEQCQGGAVEACRVMEVLADHSHGQCLQSEHPAD